MILRNDREVDAAHHCNRVERVEELGEEHLVFKLSSTIIIIITTIIIIIIIYASP